MAKAGLTIAISGTYNGRALEKARQDLEKMKISAVSELGGVGSSLINFGSQAAQVGGEIHNMGYKMEQIGSKATKGISLPIAAAALACGKAAVDIDTSLTGVKKTLNASEAEYENLKDAAIEFSKTNAVSPSQILDIEALGAQLGFTKDELQGFGEVVSGLDIATNMDAEQAGTEMAQFANIMKMAHSDISNYGSAIVGLGNNMATTESNISSMAMRLAAAGTQVGMSQADILGLAAALSSMGVEAEAGGTAISTIMSQIDKDIATNSASVETWASAASMSAQQFADAWKTDPVQALTALLSNMEKTTAEGGNMSVMLEELGIDSVRQSDIMKRLAGNSDLVTKAVALSNEEWQKNTALQNEVDNRNDSMASKLQILQNKVTAVAEKIGTPLVNALLDVVDASEPLTEGIGKAAQAFADMDEKDQKMILGLAGAAAAFGPVMTVAGKLTQGIGNLVVDVGKGAQTFGLLQSELGTVKDAFALVSGGAGTAAEGMEMVMESTTLVSGALGTLKVAMASLGIAAAVAAIGAIVLAIKDVIDHEQAVTEATYGLETAIDSAQEAYDSYAGSSENVVKSLGDIKAKSEEVIESQGKLAQSMSDQWAEYGTNAAIVDAYAQEIQSLTNKYDEHGNKLQLTAEEQTRLKLAVDGFNEATGASVQVTEALNGTLDQSVDSIMASAEAFKEQARAQAAMEMYKDLYKQQIRDEMALQEATATLTDLKNKEADSWNNLGYNGVNPYSVQVAQAQNTVDELTASMESNEATQEQLLNVIMGTSQSFDSFDSALEQSGIKLEDFGDLTEEQLEALRSSFDGKLSSIVATCNQQGIEIPQSLANAISANKDAVHEAAYGVGLDTNSGFAEGLNANAESTTSGIIAMCDGIINAAKETLGVNSPSTVMIGIGTDVDLGLQQGIEQNQSLLQQAMTSIGQVIQDAINNLPTWMMGLGANAGNMLSLGLLSGQTPTQTAGDTLFRSGKTGANPLIQALSGIGTQAGRLLSSGLSSLQGSARTAGFGLNTSAQTGARPAISAFGGIGRSSAQSFSGAIGRSSAYGSGKSLAQTAKSGLGSVSAYSTGANFSRGFANGVGGVNVWQAAYNVGRSALSAIKAALGISSPSKEAAKVGVWFGQGAVIGMQSTEADIMAESRKMSEAMSLSPTIGTRSFQPSSYAASFQTQANQGRQISFNVTINVTANNNQQAASIGRSIGDELYLEFARRERAYA